MRLFKRKKNKIQCYVDSRREKSLALELINTGLFKNTSTESGWLTKDTASIIEEATEKLAGLHYILPPYDLEALAQLPDISPAHYACVMIKAFGIAAGGWKIVPAVPADPQEHPSPPERLVNFFKNCNEEVSLEELIQILGIDYESTGNAWLEIVRSPTGKIVELNHLPAAYMYVLEPGFQEKYGLYAVQRYKSEEAYFRKALSKEELAKGYKAIYYPKDKKKLCTEVIHWKNYTPSVYFYGSPDIIPAVPAILGSKLAREHALDFFEEKGVPPYVLFVSGADFIDEEQKSIAQRFFNEQLKQEHARLLIMAFPTGVENFELEKLAEDFGPEIYTDYLLSNIDDIARAHRVPPKLLALREPRSLGGSAEAEAQLEQFNELVLKPLRRKFAQRWNKFIIDAGGWGEDYSNWEIEFVEISLQSMKDFAEVHGELLKMGVFNINELRQKLGEAPLQEDEANIYFVSAGGEPIALQQLMHSSTQFSDEDAETINRILTYLQEKGKIALLPKKVVDRIKQYPDELPEAIKDYIVEIDNGS